MTPTKINIFPLYIDDNSVYMMNTDGVVKSPPLRHSRVGGNDGMAKDLSFYEFINIAIFKILFSQIGLRLR